MRGVPTYRQGLYLLLALGLLVATGTYLHRPGDQTFLAALAFAASVLGLREVLGDILTTTGDPR